MTSAEHALAHAHASAAEADELHARSRRILVDAVRAAARAGLTQRQIATAIGRSQPEVSRLLRFTGTSELARRVSSRRRDMLAAARRAGASDIRVFGSVATGTDDDGSDVDLLVDFAETPSLMTIARLERDLASIVGAPVDIVSTGSLRARSAERILAGAVPL